MSKIEVVIKLEQPRPGSPAPAATEKKPVEKKQSIEEQVRKTIELIESGYCSDMEWKALRSFYTVLMKRKQTERIKNLRKMIKPLLSKYGYHTE